MTNSSAISVILGENGMEEWRVAERFLARGLQVRLASRSGARREGR